jgi:hypothetical protein
MLSPSLLAFRDVLVNLAEPPLSAAVPSTVEPSLKVTSSPLGGTGETVAVNVTDCPYAEGFSDEVIVVVVFVSSLAAEDVASENDNDKKDNNMKMKLAR